MPINNQSHWIANNWSTHTLFNAQFSVHIACSHDKIDSYNEFSDDCKRIQWLLLRCYVCDWMKIASQIIDINWNVLLHFSFSLCITKSTQTQTYTDQKSIFRHWSSIYKWNFAVNLHSFPNENNINQINDWTIVNMPYLSIPFEDCLCVCFVIDYGLMFVMHT